MEQGTENSSQIHTYNRSHDCGALRAEHLDHEVDLCGWVKTRRDHGGVIFIDLRDRYGVTQIVFDPSVDGGSDAYQRAHGLRSEFVLWCRGRVRRRPGGMTNEKLPTGEIEVACSELKILSEAITPPFEIDAEQEVSENLRLKYRYLDLRRPSLQKNLISRSRMISAMRRYLEENAFIDVETPILYKSTPEGARDFVVPSRLSPGEFYALPQSPQTLKQLLMISGLDRYYQMARCFRDEDLRGDRQPEFSQVDIEASFINEDVFFPIIEGMMQRVWKEVLDVNLQTPFPRMTYDEAMNRYGSDKPDVRFGFELNDVSSVFAKSEFRVFQGALMKNSFGKSGSIRAIVIPSEAEKFSRKDLDDLAAHAVVHGAKGLLWMKIQKDLTLQSPAAKFMKDEEKGELMQELKLKADDLVLMVADPSDEGAMQALGAVRLKVAAHLGAIPTDGRMNPAFLWVVDFPLFEYDDQNKRYQAKHHPFTMPKPECVDDFVKGENLLEIKAAAYDLVINGVELGSGSLRIYRSDWQDAMFRALGMTAEDAQAKFGFFLEALQFGTPPHGGVAFGIDRMAAILCGVGPIREVMAFPKTQKGQCLMSGSPSSIQPEQLVELGVSVRKK